METLPSLVVVGLVVVGRISSVVLMSVVDSTMEVVAVMSVVLRGKLVEVRPGRRAHLEA